jgi:adenylate cyclase, class 2
MPIEIEAKLKVESHDVVRARLEECGASRVGKYLETNTFFDNADRSLLNSDRGLRLRIAYDVERHRDEFTLTYKGPRQAGQIKNREERELSVGSVDDAARFLECLDFQKVFLFEKKRERWKLDGCTIELDEVPYLGFFVEIEGPSEQAISILQAKLNLDSRAMVKPSYVGLLMEYLQEKQDNSREIVFPKA